MATVNGMISALKQRATIQASEGMSDSFLSDLLYMALDAHNPTYNFDTLPKREEDLVIYLAWISICLKRAGQFASSTDLKGSSQGVAGGYGADRSTPFEKNLALASRLQKHYEQMVEALRNNEDGSGSIVVGRIYRRGSARNEIAPREMSALIPVVLIKTEVGSDYAIFNANYPSSDQFSQLVVFYTEDNKLFEMWNKEGLNGVPYVKDTATEVLRTSDRQKVFKVTGLEDATSYRFGAALNTRSGRWTVSNELVIQTRVEGSPVLQLPASPSDPEKLNEVLGEVGKAFSYQVTATNTPTSYVAIGLPAGLTLDGVTGLITGTPTAVGLFSLTIKAINAQGQDEAVQPIRIT